MQKNFFVKFCLIKIFFFLILIFFKVEISTGRRSITFQHVLTLPYHRPGSQFTCGTIRSYSNDLCLCNTEGEICLINLDSDVQLKSLNTITSSKINCISYIPANKNRKTTNSIKHRHHEHKHDFISKEQSKNIDSLLDIDSSDDDDQDSLSINSFENCLNNQQEDTIWIGTQNGG